MNLALQWLARREAPNVEFEGNEHKYTMGYYLADGIYPSFVKPISNPKVGRELISQQLKQLVGKMWREHLGCCNPGLQLCVGQLDSGIRKLFGGS